MYFAGKAAGVGAGVGDLMLAETFCCVRDFLFWDD